MRGDRLEVAKRDPQGVLVFSDRLREAREPVEELPFFLDAAEGGDESEWLLLEGTRALRWYQGGQEQFLPELPWMAMAVGFSSGAPTVVVAPAQQFPGAGIDLAPPPQGSVGAGPPPFVVRLEDDKWKTVVAGEWPDRISSPSNMVNEVRARGDVRFCATQKGEARVAWVNRYRVHFFDRNGDLELEIRSGSQDPEWVSRNEKEAAAIAADLRVAMPKVDPKILLSKRPQQKIAQIACAEDGTIYLLVWTDGGLAIDRFDRRAPEERVERIEVDGLDLPAGRISMVAASDGVTVAAFNPEHGIWQIRWEDLASAKWRPVPEVTVQRGH